MGSERARKASKWQSQDYNLTPSHSQVRVISTTTGWFNFFKKQRRMTLLDGEASITMLLRYRVEREHPQY